MSVCPIGPLGSSRTAPNSGLLNVLASSTPASARPTASALSRTAGCASSRTDRNSASVTTGPFCAPPATARKPPRRPIRLKRCMLTPFHVQVPGTNRTRAQGRGSEQQRAVRPEQERRRSASRRRLVGPSLGVRQGLRRRRRKHRHRRRVGPVHGRFRVQRDVVVVVRHDLVVVVMPVGRRPGQSRGVVLVPGREEMGCQVQPGGDRKRTRSLASEQDDHCNDTLERSAHGRDCDRRATVGQ